MTAGHLRFAIAALAALALAGSAPARAQAPASPPAAAPKPAPHAVPKPKPEAKAESKATKAVTPAPARPATPGHEPDLAYGAFQRGYYLTAFQEATKRVSNNDAEAAKWYALAAGRGDREAMFQLAMLRISGRGGPRDHAEAAKLLAAAAKLGQPAAAYDLGLLYLEGQQFPQDFKRAAELFATAAQAGSPEAEYALATLYKDGRGVPQNQQEATRLMAAAAQADFLDAEVEYAIALYNGTGTAKDEAGALTLFRKAAIRGSPIAQNRLARLYAFSQGMPPPDPVQAIKWHLVSKAGGATDPVLDDFVQKQTPAVRDAAEKAAKPWIEMIAQVRSKS
jgi:hypothetical protein